jgi:predicted short-subunit dehydrogenase-like oxidoreductase (DUF2520 family)
MDENRIIHSPSLGIIGSGRMATYLVHAFSMAEMTPQVLVSRNAESGKKLSDRYNMPLYDTIESVSQPIDIWFLAVPDDAIAAVAVKMSTAFSDAILVHCSGAFDTSQIASFHSGSACFYPLQTFSGDIPADLDGIPILISASDDHISEVLTQLAQKISQQVFTIGDSDRLVVHLAAVFANNFTNLMLRFSEDILESRELTFGLLFRLLQETVDKAKRIGPDAAQTGPAQRGDLNTLARHREWLASRQPQLLTMYDLCTEFITKMRPNP